MVAVCHPQFAPRPRPSRLRNCAASLASLLLFGDVCPLTTHPLHPSRHTSLPAFTPTRVLHTRPHSPAPCTLHDISPPSRGLTHGTLPGPLVLPPALALCFMPPHTQLYIHAPYRAPLLATSVTRGLSPSALTAFLPAIPAHCLSGPASRRAVSLSPPPLGYAHPRDSSAPLSDAFAVLETPTRDSSSPPSHWYSIPFLMSLVFRPRFTTSCRACASLCSCSITARSLPLPLARVHASHPPALPPPRVLHAPHSWLFPGLFPLHVPHVPPRPPPHFLTFPARFAAAARLGALTPLVTLPRALLRVRCFRPMRLGYHPHLPRRHALAYVITRVLCSPLIPAGAAVQRTFLPSAPPFVLPRSLHRSHTCFSAPSSAPAPPRRHLLRPHALRSPARLFVPLADCHEHHHL